MLKRTASIVSMLAVTWMGSVGAARPSAVTAPSRAGAAASSLSSTDVETARGCVADETAPVIFYGRVPAVDMVSSEKSFVEILPQSVATSLYFSVLESNVTGSSWLPANAYSDPNFLQKGVEIMQQLQMAMQSSKSARILHTGEFVCRGFGPGKYSFMATVHAVGRSESSSEPTFETYLYRSDVMVPPTHKSRVIVTVPAFRLLGQSPK